jgi:hypothetical protein
MALALRIHSLVLLVLVTTWAGATEIETIYVVPFTHNDVGFDATPKQMAATVRPDCAEVLRMEQDQLTRAVSQCFPVMALSWRPGFPAAFSSFRAALVARSPNKRTWRSWKLCLIGTEQAHRYKTLANRCVGREFCSEIPVRFIGIANAPADDQNSAGTTP